MLNIFRKSHANNWPRQKFKIERNNKLERQRKVRKLLEIKIK